MRRILQTAILWMFRLFVIACAMIAVAAAYQRLNGKQIPMVMGWGVATVVSGSMEPEIPTSALIFIQEQAVDSYEVGDIVIYQSETASKSITHRIISIEGDTMITQGDANNVADPPISVSQIIGKVQFWTPALGNLKEIISITSLVVLGTFVIVYCVEKERKE